MSCTIDATVGGALSNSYLTVAEADAYFSTRLRVDPWIESPDDLKCRALVSATAILDDWVEWDGAPGALTQRLAWPRWGLLTVAGDAIEPTVIPEALKAATCELALLLLSEDVLATPDAQKAGLTALTAGPVSLTFAGPAGQPSAGDRVLPPQVWQRIARWACAKRGAGVVAKLERA